MNAGKIEYFLEVINNYRKAIESLESKIESENEKYNNSLKTYNQIVGKVYEENKKNANDFKTIFNSVYNSEMKILKETFNNNNRIFYNKGFYLDKDKEMLRFKTKAEVIIETGYMRTFKNEVVFFFKEAVEINLIKLIVKDDFGINVIPDQIYVKNSLGESFFLEDFSRYISSNDEVDTQLFISNIKKASEVKFIFNKPVNWIDSSFAFFKLSYIEDNEIILNFENIFKNNSLVKLSRNISDKLKILEYAISFDNGITYQNFDWKNSQLDGLDSEDNIKIISLPEKKSENIFIKIYSDKTKPLKDIQKVVKKEKYIQSFDGTMTSENDYTYLIDDHGGRIVNESIKIYFSNKNAKKINEHNKNILDSSSEEKRISVGDGFINVHKETITNDELYYLMDFDDLESLSKINDELGYYINGKLYLPVLFAEENIDFRVSYDVEFTEENININNYTPFIFDFDIVGGDSFENK